MSNKPSKKNRHYPEKWMKKEELIGKIEATIAFGTEQDKKELLVKCMKHMGGPTLDVVLRAYQKRIEETWND